VIEQDDERLMAIARDAGHLPSDLAQRIVFLSLSGQWDACETCDLDGTHLRSAYEAAPAELRRRIAEAARAAGRTEWVEVAVGGSRHRRLAEMMFGEWKAVLALLCRPEHAAEAWRLAQEAPPVHARELLLRLADTRALSENDRDGYARLRSLAELCTDEVPFDSAAAICAATLRGHEGWVSSLAITPGGALLASGSADKTIRLWHLPGGKRAATLRGHGDTVTSLAITPDGALLASGSYDRTIRLWHLPGGEPAATLRGHEDTVTSLAVTPGGELLASGSWDNQIRLWHLPGGEPAATLRGHEGWIYSLAITPDGTLLVSGGGGRTTRLWHLPGGEPAATLRGHKDTVTSLAVTPGGALLASGSLDKTIRLWHSKVAVLAGTPVAVLARRHDHLLKLNRTPDLAASARAWLDFMLALVERHRRYDIDVEVSAHVEVGEFDIEIGS